MNYDLNNFTRLTITVVIIFIVVKLLVETRMIEAILLAFIIAFSIFIAENIINLHYINPDYDSCKKCITETENKNNKENFATIISNDVPNDVPNNVSNSVVSDSTPEQRVAQYEKEQKITTEKKETIPTKQIEDPKGGQTFEDGYVAYQQNGQQDIANEKLFKENQFRMKIGNPELVDSFVKDGNQYYYDIYSYSTNTPNAKQSMESDMKYGDYNYIGPINKGMINPEYTYIAPSNWYPIPPFPPQCVTNKKCTTCPIMMNDGNQYMTFTSLKDFNKARRFTGNMGINTEYIKNVLNNGEGY